MAGNPHTPLGLFKCCDINRKNVPNSPFIEKNPSILNNLTVPYIKHFCFKTIEEYLKKFTPRICLRDWR